MQQDERDNEVDFHYPGDLNGEQAREFYRVLLPELQQSPNFKAGHIPFLIQYCNTQAQIVKLHKMMGEFPVTRNGSGSVIVSPYIKTVNSLTVVALQLAKVLGVGRIASNKPSEKPAVPALLAFNEKAS